MRRLFFMLLIVLLFVGCDSDSENVEDDIVDEKPVIYLYPEEKREVTVQLEYDGELMYTYPEYEDGWRVTAYPDGRLVNLADEREYSYLFWEGISDNDWEFDEGFVVAGDETEEFLIEKLSYLGLEPHEYNEFIVYWGPRMSCNPYNVVSFVGEAYEEIAPLKVVPEPDSIQRVFMIFKALDEPIEIRNQALKAFSREGFSVIEWGGAEVK